MNVCLFFDGTWNHPEQTNKEGELTPTNAFRLFKASQVSNGLSSQKSYYDSGVGTDGNWFDRVAGGIFGSGLSKNITDAYIWLSNNYTSEDKLYIFGFSRGAYSARSLIGMIDKVGLIPGQSTEDVLNLYKIYKDRDASLESDHVQMIRKDSLDVEVSVLGCWDTVGALGIPFESFNGFNKSLWGFHNTSVSRIVKEAYHAVAIDEHRSHFQHTPMHCSEGTRHETMYFHGSHSDVGGGIIDGGISNISLNWMAQKASSAGLSVAKERIPAICYDDVMQPITDSYSKFLKGFYSKFEGRYLRELRLSHMNCKIHPLTISRVEADEQYRPENIKPILDKVITPTLDDLGIEALRG